MNKLNKLVTIMAVTTMTLGVNAGDMKQNCFSLVNHRCFITRYFTNITIWGWWHKSRYRCKFHARDISTNAILLVSIGLSVSEAQSTVLGGQVYDEIGECHIAGTRFKTPCRNKVKPAENLLGGIGVLSQGTLPISQFEAGGIRVDIGVSFTHGTFPRTPAIKQLPCSSYRLPPKRFSAGFTLLRRWKSIA
jgi:hypothetical protein